MAAPHRMTRGYSTDRIDDDAARLPDPRWSSVGSGWSRLKGLYEGPQATFRVPGAVLAVAVRLVDRRIHDVGARLAGLLVVRIDVLNNDRGGRARGTEGLG